MSRVCIAQIGAAHGVRGEVRLKSFTEDPLSVTRYGALESEDGKRRFEIESVRPAKDMLVARFRGVTDRNAAEALKNIDKGRLILEELSAADAANTELRTALADAYRAQGDAQAKLAASLKSADHWRAARSWYEKGSAIYNDLSSRNQLPASLERPIVTAAKVLA